MKKSLIFCLITLLVGCGGEDNGTSNSTNSPSDNGFTNVNASGNASGYAEEETVTSEAVYINDKKLDPPASPTSRLKLSFGGRQKLYSPMINRVSKRYGVDPFLTHAIISQESWYRPTVGSNAGAVGMMQLISSAGRRFGCTNRTDAKCNVTAGVKYLKFLAQRYEGRGNIQTIAAGYNAGEAVADSYLSGTKLKGKNPLGRQTPNGVPGASFGYRQSQKNSCNNVNVLPGYKCEGETYAYARNVAGYYLRYKRNPKLVAMGNGVVRAPSVRAARRGNL